MARRGEGLAYLLLDWDAWVSAERETFSSIDMYGRSILWGEYTHTYVNAYNFNLHVCF